MEQINTCQICGRSIKASKGVIAHHGYKRPAGKNHNGYGWQTASCMGARHLPYEESSDVLPVAIAQVKRHIENETQSLATFISNPPAVLIHQAYAGMGTYKDVEYTRPDNFDVNKYHNCIIGYAWEHSARRHEMQRNIEGSKATLEFLEDRLNNWKKVR